MTPEQLFEQNAALVHHTMRKMGMRWRASRARLEEADVEQMGMMGLWHACQRFEPARGHKFSTYAVRCISGFILTGVNRHQFGGDYKPGRLDQSAMLLRGDRDELDEAELPRVFDDAMRSEQVAAVRSAVASLPGHMPTVVRMRMAGLTLREAGRAVGVSLERARQIEVAARALLAIRLRSHRPEPAELAEAG